MDRNWTLTLSFRGPCGENYHHSVEVDGFTASEQLHAPVPGPFDMRAPRAFDGTVALLRRKEFRKDLFMHEAAQLGAALAQRMTDKEGWHGVDRSMALKDWGRPESAADIERRAPLDIP